MNEDQLIRQLSTYERRFRAVFEHAPMAALVLDSRDWAVLEANTAAVHMLQNERVKGRPFFSLFAPEDQEGVRRQLADWIAGRATQVATNVVYQDGCVVPVGILLTACAENEALAVISHEAEQMHGKEILSHLAFHDPLTGLVNRSLFMTRLEEVMTRMDRDQPSMALVYVDLDDFKIINDSLGHGAGDAFLVETARRLVACVGPDDTVARMGGDEFTILVAHTLDTDDAIRMAETVLQELQKPFWVEGYRLVITSSVGVVMGNQASDAKELLGYADIAMYQAKQNGKARYAAFSPPMHQQIMHRLELESDLRRAVDQGEFTVVYQPIVDLVSMRKTGVEALIRWNRPGRGQVSPAEFIPLAEATGLIIPIGRWVLREACVQARKWQDISPGLIVSVNLSAKQFQEPFLARQVEEILAETDLDPECLVLEITETVLVQDPDYAGKVLDELKALRVSVALDDFGTGYSSLNYLKRFPIDILKIDRSFVEELGKTARDETLVRSVVMLAGALKLKVTAEGLETDQQARLLRAMGCGHGQGYALGRPAPAAALTDQLVAQASLAESVLGSANLNAVGDDDET